MNFENIPIEENNIPEETVQSTEGKTSNDIGRWLKKTVALAGAIGVGYFGGLQDSNAEINNNLEKDTSPKLEHKESSTLEPDILYEDAQTKWQVEYVEKNNQRGEKILALRYSKTDLSTGVTTVIGQYDNLIQANESLSKISDVPERVLKSVRIALDAIDIEKSFENSGFVKQDGEYSGKNKIEMREFKGYGLDVVNKVEVDKNGKIIDIINTKSKK